MVPQLDDLGPAIALDVANEPGQRWGPFDSLQEGDAVTFETAPDAGRGPRAVNVALVVEQAVR